MIDFGINRVFDATVDSNIILIKNCSNENNFQVCTFTKGIGFSNFRNIIKNNCQIKKGLSESEWLLSTDKFKSIREKIEKNGVELKSWDVKFFRGILTGFNKAFIIDGDTKDILIAKDKNISNLIKPILRGRDVLKYLPDFKDLWLINPHNGYINQNGTKVLPINISDFPVLKIYLDRYQNNLVNRIDQGNTFYNLRSCAYLEEFSKEKIVWQAISKNISFCYDNTSIYLDVSTFFLTGEYLKFILAVFNSKFFEFSLINIYLEGDTFKSKNKIMHDFPIPKITQLHQKPFENIIDKIITNKKVNQNANTKELEAQIDRLVYDLYELSEDEISIVEESVGG